MRRKNITKTIIFPCTTTITKTPFIGKGLSFITTNKEIEKEKKKKEEEKEEEEKKEEEEEEEENEKDEKDEKDENEKKQMFSTKPQEMKRNENNMNNNDESIFTLITNDLHTCLELCHDAFINCYTQLCEYEENAVQSF